jgi:hypothetical protein
MGCLIARARRLLLRQFLVYTLLLRQRMALLLQRTVEGAPCADEGYLLHTHKTDHSRRLQLIPKFEIYSYQCVSFAGIPQPSTQYRTTSTTEPSIPAEKGE